MFSIKWIVFSALLIIARPAQSQTFIDVVGGDYSFNFYTESSTGRITNVTAAHCTAGDYSFGYGVPYVRGSYSWCAAGDYSFGCRPGSVVDININAHDCRAGSYSFGYGHTVVLDGSLNRVVAADYSMGAGSNVVMRAAINSSTAAHSSIGSGDVVVFESTVRHTQAGSGSVGRAYTELTFDGRIIQSQAGTESFYVEAAATQDVATVYSYPVVWGSGVESFGRHYLTSQAYFNTTSDHTFYGGGPLGIGTALMGFDVRYYAGPRLQAIPTAENDVYNGAYDHPDVAMPAQWRPPYVLTGRIDLMTITRVLRGAAKLRDDGVAIGHPDFMQFQRPWNLTFSAPFFVAEGALRVVGTGELPQGEFDDRSVWFSDGAAYLARPRQYRYKLPSGEFETVHYVYWEALDAIHGAAIEGDVGPDIVYDATAESWVTHGEFPSSAITVGAGRIVTHSDDGTSVVDVAQASFGLSVGLNYVFVDADTATLGLQAFTRPESSTTAYRKVLWTIKYDGFDFELVRRDHGSDVEIYGWRD